MISEEQRRAEFQRYVQETCSICRTSTSLCKTCNAHYCSKCKEHTSELCTKFKLAKLCGNVIKQEEMRVTPPYVPPVPSETLQAFSNWESYFAERCTYKQRLTYTERNTLSAPWRQLLSEEKLREETAAIITETLTFPCTIVHALHRIYGAEALSSKKTLEIHVVGAAMVPELVQVLAFEEIRNLIPNLTSLELVFQGPEIEDPEAGYMIESHNGAVMNVKLFGGLLYHEFAQQHSAAYHKPDLFIAFNSGVHDTPESWAPTIQFIAQQQINAAFTSYTAEEATADMQIFATHLSSKIYSTRESFINPFMSNMPHIDFFNGFGCFHQNQYCNLFITSPTAPQ